MTRKELPTKREKRGKEKDETQNWIIKKKPSIKASEILKFEKDIFVKKGLLSKIKWKCKTIIMKFSRIITRIRLSIF
jgi:hypothetical protein